jgi:hypothetical protein
MFGATNRNFPLENVMQTPGGWLDKVKSNWRLMLPCLLALFAAVAFAWAERGVRGLDPRKIPPLAGLWPWRFTVLIALAAFSFTLMFIQVNYGFGLEQAIRTVVTEQFSEQREAAIGRPDKLAKLEYLEELELAKFNLEHTTWHCLALICNFLAVLAILCRICFDKRGSKPPPRIVIQY